MAKQKGRLFLLQVGDGAGPEVFTTIASTRSKTLTINGEAVDVTDDNSDGMRELLGGAGISSMSMSVSGIYDASTNQHLLESRCLARTLHNYKLIDEANRSYTGSFQVTSYEKTGEYNGAVQFSATIESSGDVAIA